MTPLQFTAAEARVLAALVEKSVTTPQYYPLTVNALMLAANQKSSRNPVMALSEGDVGAALNQLEELKLVARDDFGARVPKWRHHFHSQLLLKPPVMAVLAALMLRGPQTLSELRANAQPMGGPADADGINVALQDLSDRAQPLVTLLPRASGQSTLRYAHTLSGEVAVPFAAEIRAAAPASTDSLTLLTERIAALEARVAELEHAQSSTIRGPI